MIASYHSVLSYTEHWAVPVSVLVDVVPSVAGTVNDPAVELGGSSVDSEGSVSACSEYFSS